MSQSAVSIRYTSALIDAAQESGVLDRVEADVQALLDLLHASEDLREFVADPMMRSEQKRAVLNNLLAGKIEDITLRFCYCCATIAASAYCPNCYRTSYPYWKIGAARPRLR